MKHKVYNVLKPKVSAFGFDKKEVTGLAEEIAKNLNLNEDATEEEINEAIENAVSSVIPYLKFGQSQANRVINDFKKSQEEKENAKSEKKESKEEGEEKKMESKEDEALKALTDSIKSLETKLLALESEKVGSLRRSKLEKILSGSGTFGKSKLRDFDRMIIETEEDFEAFCEEIETDLKNLVQEAANDGLGKLTPPTQEATKKEDVMSDAELDRLAEGM